MRDGFDKPLYQNDAGNLKIANPLGFFSKRGPEGKKKTFFF